jgi:hypothetical protein
MDWYVDHSLGTVAVTECVGTVAEDNYAILLSHFTRQYGVDPDEIRRHLGVSEDYEDIC